ncbi:MAG: hypothetical protein ACI4BD_05960 [Paludibacteraceae bacterium]
MNILYTKLAAQLLPTFLRQPVILSLLNVMIRPIQQLHDTHRQARDTRLYELQHTGQVCHIKDALNHNFGIGNYASSPDYQSGFDIEDINALGEWLMVYDEADAFGDQHTIVEDTTMQMLYDEAAILAQTDTFIVLVPKSVDYDRYQYVIQQIVNQYRLASRTAVIRIKN